MEATTAVTLATTEIIGEPRCFPAPGAWRKSPAPHGFNGYR